MQALFKRARAAAPTIIFFDEVDALACKRGGGGEGGAGATERVLTQVRTLGASSRVSDGRPIPKSWGFFWLQVLWGMGQSDMGWGSSKYQDPGEDYE